MLSTDQGVSQSIGLSDEPKMWCEAQCRAVAFVVLPANLSGFFCKLEPRPTLAGFWGLCVSACRERAESQRTHSSWQDASRVAKGLEMEMLVRSKLTKKKPHNHDDAETEMPT